MRAPAHARLGRAFVAIAVAMAACVVGETAAAYYEESHVTGDEIRVTVDSAGGARIEHALSWRLVAGQPHGLDLAGTEPSAQPEPIATLEAEDGRVLQATVTAMPGRGLHLAILEPKALRHGQQYRVHLAYAVNLPLAGELARDGQAYDLLWKSPTPSEGFDGAKVTFVLPAAIEAPAALIGEGGMRDDGVASTLKREPDHDEIEIVRPHVGRGEEVLWVVRIAAKVFEAGKSGGLAPPPPPPRRETPLGAGTLAYAMLGVLAFAFACAVSWKDRRFAAACRALGVPARALVPLRSWERAAAAGAALFVGLSLQLVDVLIVGSLFVVLAMVCTVLRSPRVTASPRGPGRWLVLRPEEAFARRSGTSPTGAVVVLVMALALSFGAGRLLAPSHPEAMRFLLLDLMVLVPLLATGTASQLTDRAGHRGPWLARLFRRLQKAKNLRVSPWARVPTGRARPDEVRVLIVPRAPMPGLSAIEVGFARGQGASSFVSTPEVLVRVHDATAASARLTKLALDLPPVPGRKPEERVFRIVPRFPTLDATAALVLRLGLLLVDRRLADPAWPKTWEEKERRVTPLVRDADGSSAPFPVLG